MENGYPAGKFPLPVAFEGTEDADDNGTNALMDDYIQEQEKSVWICSSFLGKK